MSTLTIAEAELNLRELCSAVAETGEPVVIQRGGRGVMIDPVQDEAEEERRTRMLLDSPRNAERLRAALARAAAGEGFRMSVAELRASL